VTVAGDKPVRAGSLTIVGTGILLAGQITVQSLSAIEAATRVFYLVASPAAGVWLRRMKPDAVSLHGLYGERKPREQTYVEMADAVLDAVRAGERVCAAFYGHPGVGVDPAQQLMQRAKADGYRVRMLPGISAEACLYADVGLDPLERGCQSYEATDFVNRRPRIATDAALLLWQIGIIGLSFGNITKAHLPGIEQLVAVLSDLYPADHEVVVYEAPAYPTLQPMIDRRPLRDLASARLSPISTLYVPPVDT
jgi:uncharacterized protein YabN with tetrapyrrole methylase and pyrophosphatase domain